MSAAAQKRYEPLEEEQRAFEAALDELLKEHAGQFVVFKGGKPIGYYPAYQDAYKDALDRFGDEVFLISEVRRQKNNPVSISWVTGAMFG